MFLKRFFEAGDNPGPQGPDLRPLASASLTPLASRSALESADRGELVRCNARIVNYLLWVANLRPEDICPASLLSYCVHLYADQVAALGHDAFARVFGSRRQWSRSLGEGLSAFGSPAHCDVYAGMTQLPLLGGSRRGRDRQDAAAALDAKFSAAQALRPLNEANARWLRDRPLEMVEDADLDQAMRSRAAACTQLPIAHAVDESRKAEQLRIELAMQLCVLCDRIWTGWIARIPQRVAAGPGRSVDTLAWLATTSRGPCVVYFVEGRAVLADRETTDILARLPMPF